MFNVEQAKKLRSPKLANSKSKIGFGIKKSIGIPMPSKASANNEQKSNNISGADQQQKSANQLVQQDDDHQPKTRPLIQKLGPKHSRSNLKAKKEETNFMQTQDPKKYMNSKDEAILWTEHEAQQMEQMQQLSVYYSTHEKLNRQDRRAKN